VTDTTIDSVKPFQLQREFARWSHLSRHVQGDYGDVDAEDRQANLDAIKLMRLRGQRPAR